MTFHINLVKNYTNYEAQDITNRSGIDKATSSAESAEISKNIAVHIGSTSKCQLKVQLLWLSKSEFSIFRFPTWIQIAFHLELRNILWLWIPPGCVGTLHLAFNFTLHSSPAMKKDGSFIVCFNQPKWFWLSLDIYGIYRIYRFS